jgi:hypothetical protein
MERAMMCPQCNAPLAPHHFASSVVCSYCGATVRLDDSPVSAAAFHQAYRFWNSPKSYQVAAWITLGESHWILEQCIAHGGIADVYTGRRARWPTELVVVKLLRDRKDAALLDNEWETLRTLLRSEAAGADTFTALLPQPVVHGDAGPGEHAGGRLSIFRWQGGFRHSLAEVIKAYPQGIPPRASIWLWRRILEVLSFLHTSNVVHGALIPSHILIQDNEHGARLVGYGCAGRPGSKLAAVSPGFEAYYPKPGPLTEQLDLSMSARCMAAALGGDPAAASLPAAVPGPLAEIIQRVARSDPGGKGTGNAWVLRNELGKIAEQVFGPPQFIPIVMPS